MILWWEFFLYMVASHVELLPLKLEISLFASYVRVKCPKQIEKNWNFGILNLFLILKDFCLRPGLPKLTRWKTQNLVWDFPF